MTHDDPLRTHHEVATTIMAELAAAGFEDAMEIGRGGFGVVYRCCQIAPEPGAIASVKPGNIMRTDDGEPALADFGMAHIAGGFQTAAGIVTESPAFSAPEVLNGDAPAAAADVYGLGATLFCALTGHAAFQRGKGENVVTQFLRITAQPMPDLRDSGIPDDVSVVWRLR